MEIIILEIIIPFTPAVQLNYQIYGYEDKFSGLDKIRSHIICLIKIVLFVKSSEANTYSPESLENQITCKRLCR